MNRKQDADQLARMSALLGRKDPAGETIAWYALGVRPAKTLTGKLDRRVLLPVIASQLSP